MSDARTRFVLPRQDFDAVIFDMDGVVTDTAMLHGESWKKMFDGFLQGYAGEAGRAGGFGLVIGVDRVGDPEALRSNGADVVVADLAEVTVSVV